MSAAVATAPGAASRGGSSMSGLGTCLRLALRRSRVYWTLWIITLATMMPATVTKYHDLVPDGAAGKATLDAMAAMVTMRAMLGQPYDLSTPGGFAFWRVGEFTAAVAGMMAGWGVIRATRSEEEEGRIELVRSGAVGRHAPLLAGVVASLLACLLVALLTATFMVAVGTPVAGSLAAGLGIGLTGAMFVGVGAVFAQVYSSARTAIAMTLGAVLGGLYVLRAVVDSSGDNLPAQWAMPLDWPALVRPYAGERWWVLLLPLLMTAALLALAFSLESRRDHGAGLVAARLGRANAKPGLRSAQALALRLQTGGIRGWALGIGLGSLIMGSMALSMDKFVAGNVNIEAMLRKMGGGTGALSDAFYQAMLGIMVGLIGFMAVTMLHRLRSEETHGHAEVLLATATSRRQFAWSHLSLALIAPSILLLATGPLMGVLKVAKDHDTGILWTLFKAGLCLWPGLILLVGLAMFLHGWVPRLFGIVWAVLGWTIFVSWIGSLLNLPEWAAKLHPWGHLPHLPADAVSWPWIFGETVIGIVLLVLGLVGYGRRDITTT